MSASDKIFSNYLAALKALKAVKPEPEAIMGTFERLPDVPPMTDEIIAQLQSWVDDCPEEIAKAKAIMQGASTENAPIDWNMIVYHLMVAWVVNYRLDVEATKARDSVQAGDDQSAIELVKNAQKYCVQGAKILGLEFKLLVDLVQVAYDPDAEKPTCGAFAGLFISHGENPFMILSIKGTTEVWESNTNLMIQPVEPAPGYLFGQKTHGGFYQGLFAKFPGQENCAFEVIYDALEIEAAKLKEKTGQNVPLYVSGHSLGAAYATLAYAQLLQRQPTDGASRSYSLKDCYPFASPRVGSNDFAKAVRDNLDGRKTWRMVVRSDIVPTIPATAGTIFQPFAYIHLDGGHRLLTKEPYLGQIASEIDGYPVGDLSPAWKWHMPWAYYTAIRRSMGRPLPEEGKHA